MYRGFIKEITNLDGKPIGNADLRVRTFNISRDILTNANSSFEVLGIPKEAQNGNIFGCYDDYGKIIYLGVITNIDDKVIQTDQIISIFNDNWLWNDPRSTTIENTVKLILEQDYKNNRDILVKDIFRQFDIVIDSPGTQLVLGTQDENYVKNFMDFVFSLYQDYQILLDIDIKYGEERPTITIRKPDYPTIKLFNNNNSLQNFNIIKETYETNKLVVYNQDGEYRGTWYGTENGITDNDDYTSRLPKIKTNIVFSDDEINIIKAQNLRNQMYNHKITVDLVLESKLYNFDDFNLGQEFDIFYEGETYHSVLTGYEISVDEIGKASIVNLTFGIVRVDLTQKLNRLVRDLNNTGTTPYSTKAKEDSEGNVIIETYLKSALAEQIYLKISDASDTYVKKSGDTMTGQLTINSNLDVSERTHLRNGLELYGPSTSTNGGYIDFHYQNSSLDYTTRLIESDNQFSIYNNSSKRASYTFRVLNSAAEYNTYIRYSTQSNGNIYWGINGSSTRTGSQTKAWLVNAVRSGSSYSNTDVINIFDDKQYNFFNGGLFINRLTSGNMNSLLPTTNRFTVYNVSTALTNSPGYWGEVISMRGDDSNDGTQLFQANTADKVFWRRQSGGTWGRWRQLPVIANQGTVVLTFSNGQCNWDISSLGLGARPNNIILTMQSHDGFVRYNYDGSSATTAVLRAYYVNGTAVAPLSTSVRVGYIIVMN